MVLWLTQWLSEMFESETAWWQQINTSRALQITFVCKVLWKFGKFTPNIFPF